MSQTRYYREEIKLYREAVACMELIAQQVQRPEIIDLPVVSGLYERCCNLIMDLKTKESNPLFTATLEQLLTTVTHQRKYFLEGHKVKGGNDQDFAAPLPQTHMNPETIVSGVDAQTKVRQLAVEDTVVAERKKLRFEDVSGLHEAKQLLKEAIVLPLLLPSLFTGARKPWTRILLFGPPGTGKSRLAQAVAGEIQSTFYSVSSADLISSWVGESEKMIKELFAHAKQQEGKSVIFIDEIDSLCRQRSVREEEHTRRVKTELLRQIEGAENSDTDKVFLLCATNCPWELDLAFLRRFQRRIYIPLPDRSTRISIMKQHCQDTAVFLTESDWKWLSDKTEGYSGSDLATLTLSALFEPIRDLQSSRFWQFTDGNKITPCSSDVIGAMQFSITSLPPFQVVPRTVNVKDFLKAVSTTPRTVHAEDLSNFKTFTSKFGQVG